MTIQELKAKYGSYQDFLAETAKPFFKKKAAPVNPGSFTENERAILLRSVIDALRAKGVEFNIWHKHGLSRIYFPDGSWLSYSTVGRGIFGPDKTGVAYQIWEELGLRKTVKRETDD